jgi:3-isopropylmalate dehydratase small subunit
MFNCGMLAIELSEADIDKLFRHKNRDVSISVDFDNNVLTVSAGKERK